MVTGFLFSGVGGWLVGLVGGSNQPISGLALSALIVAALVMVAIGVTGLPGVAAVLAVAAVACCATSMAGSMIQDLKVGHLVGGTPWRMEVAEIVSTAVVAFVMVVPIIVVGVATYLYFAPLGLADSYFGLIIVHAALGAPFVLTTVLATLAGFNHNLVRASLSLGETPLATFFRITLPVIAPGVISGALFAFATSSDEVVVTLFLAGADQSTLPRQMFNGIRENISPTIAAVATLLILFTTSLLLALEWLRTRRG